MPFRAHSRDQTTLSPGIQGSAQSGTKFFMGSSTQVPPGQAPLSTSNWACGSPLLPRTSGVKILPCLLWEAGLATQSLPGLALFMSVPRAMLAATVYFLRCQLRA